MLNSFSPKTGFVGEEELPLINRHSQSELKPCPRQKLACGYLTPIQSVTQKPKTRAKPPKSRCQKCLLSRHRAALIAAQNTNMAANAKPPATVKIPLIIEAALAFP